MKCIPDNKKILAFTHELLAQIVAKRPLILNITNAVTMDFIANGLLCLGASPVMSLAVEEVAELLQYASALVINTGTLHADWITLAMHAGELANTLNKPIILDPVGAGATRLRTETCLQLIDNLRITVIRGNAGEINALLGATGHMRGVDSAIAGEVDSAAAQILAARYLTTVVMSGEMDVIADSTRVQCLQGGSALMPQITGTGCLMSAVVAAFNAVSTDPFQASLAASVFYGICGEQAATLAQAPGSFKTQFLDALYTKPALKAYYA
jgi:hydroxyethylthiazole kinase